MSFLNSSLPPSFQSHFKRANRQAFGFDFSFNDLVTDQTQINSIKVKAEHRATDLLSELK